MPSKLTSNHRILRFWDMSSIFLPFFRGQKTSFFRLFFAQNSDQNHYMLWSNPTFLARTTTRHQNYRFYMAQTVHLDVLCVFFDFLVQGNTFTRFFTFSSLKETRPRFKVEWSIWMFYHYSPFYNLLIQSEWQKSVLQFDNFLIWQIIVVVN